jgi:hypothetical protein
VGTDFNTKYKLTPDPVWDDATLLTPHPLSAGFVRIDTGHPPSLVDVQNVLAPIVLIPPVPDSVRYTFQLAKRLYLFGRFEYGFFTVSEHYAFLAMEAAIFSRWTASLPNPVKVESAKFKTELHSPSHQKLLELWMSGGRTLKVNGEPFPHSMEKVLGHLESMRVISAETRVRLSAAINLRNTLSHVESSSIFTPSINTLSIIAEMINTLFDGLGQ